MCTILYCTNLDNWLLQFECKNTLSDQILENVRVQIEASEGYRIVKEIPIASLHYNEGAHCAYTVLQFPEQLSLTVSKCIINMSYKFYFRENYLND